KPTLFFVNPPTTHQLSTLSLHDALPIYVDADAQWAGGGMRLRPRSRVPARLFEHPTPDRHDEAGLLGDGNEFSRGNHPEETGLKIGRATSELQSHLNLVCRLLLEKKTNT